MTTKVVLAALTPVFVVWFGKEYVAGTGFVATRASSHSHGLGSGRA
jgi:hypothetical protein